MPGRDRTRLAARSLAGFVRANVESGTVVRTDGWQGYAPLTSMGYRHRSRTREDDPRRAAKLLPRIHRVFGNLQTWLRGTHHGVGHKRLQVYLDEFTFSIQSPSYAAGSLPDAPRARRSEGTDDLPAVV